MKAMVIQQRVFLFLQGPPGPFFEELGQELAKRGALVRRINLNGGDQYNWHSESTDFRGRFQNWPMFFDRFCRTHGITDLVLYGDCRPMHKAALRLARLRGIRIHVFEEGYIRPNWMTLERDGVNGHSSLPRDPRAIVDMAKSLPPVPDLPPITASFGRRARDSYWYYHHVLTGLYRFPFYHSHRQAAILHEGFGWLYKFFWAKRRAKLAEETLQAIERRKYFLFPLQLTGDFQIRAHSPFGSMMTACDYVLDSFAQFAPADSLLVVKEHPLDCRFGDWRLWLRKRARELGLADRVLHIDGGDLQHLAEHALGVVCVNSTSGTLALESGRPVIVLGDAVYDIPGVTHQGALDQFWLRPMAPDPVIYQAFKKALHAHCLVRGGLASESAMAILVENSVERLLGEAYVDMPIAATMPVS
jgi:capsular polysaccharide export protein